MPLKKFFLSGRNLIETVIEQLKSICHIEHSRHGNPLNFCSHSPQSATSCPTVVMQSLPY